MARSIVPAADEVLDREFPVLDHGFVRLVDYLGGDDRIVSAARVSYGRGTKTKREDSKLIDYLVRNSHTSPLEQVILTFHVKLPIFVARQWVRHRTARLNEVSGRYSVVQDEFYVPSIEVIRGQSASNRQSRSDEELDSSVQERVRDQVTRDQRVVYTSYEDMLNSGVARELARINLPLSTYTQWYWQIDLHNLFNFIKLRLDDHAQLEIREYARVIAELTQRVAPVAYEAFEEHVLHGKKLSRTTIQRLRGFIEEVPDASLRGALLSLLSSD